MSSRKARCTTEYLGCDKEAAKNSEPRVAPRYPHTTIQYRLLGPELHRYVLSRSSSSQITPPSSCDMLTRLASLETCVPYATMRGCLFFFFCVLLPPHGFMRLVHLCYDFVQIFFASGPGLVLLHVVHEAPSRRASQGHEWLANNTAKCEM